jgi:hypothetical protein
MELGEASFLGAVDELTLVLVCAGICAANLVTYHIPFRKLGKRSTLSKADVTLCQRGLLVNTLCGDFVEVCYPFMERYTLVNVGGYLASGMSTAWLVLSDETPKSLAYLPLPVSIALVGQQWIRMAQASLIAVGIAFFATLLNALISCKVKR